MLSNSFSGVLDNKPCLAEVQDSFATTAQIDYCSSDAVHSLLMMSVCRNTDLMAAIL